MDVAHAIGEVASEDAQARPDLEDDVVGVELGEATDDAEDVLVDEKVLAERLLGSDAHGSAKAAAAFACGRRGKVIEGLATRLGQDVQRVDDVRRLVRSSAERLRREVRAVGLDEDAVARDRALPPRAGRPRSGT